MVSKMRTMTTLLLALAMTLAPAATVAAQQGEETPYETTVEDDHATITIDHTLGDRSASTEVAFDTDEGAFATAFNYENATSEATSQLAVALHQLVEYEDTNGNGVYDAEDEVASAWKIANASKNVTGTSNGTLAWQPLEEKNATSDDGMAGTRIVGEARFPAQDPIAGVLEQIGQGENRTFTVDLRVFGQPVTLDGEQLGPMQVQVDLGVTNYPYTANGTQLALVTGTASEQTITVDEGASQVAASKMLEYHQVDLAFAWQDEATVDDEIQPVATTTLEQPSDEDADEAESDSENDDEATTLLAFSYARGDEIAHGTTIGAHATTLDETAIDRARDGLDAVPGVTAWIALVGIASTALVVGRRR